MNKSAKTRSVRKANLNEQWATLHRKRPQLLFHYTNAQGLNGLMQSKHIWATNSRFMNDPTEIAYAIDLIRAVMIARTPNNKKDFLNKILSQFLEEYDQNAKVYIACFCMNGDLLSQWRGYGAIGGGYAIGFKASQLGYPDVGWSGRPRPILRKVIYDRKIQEHIITTWLQEISASTRLSNRLRTTKTRDQLYAQLYGQYGYFLSEFLNCFKDPAYQEEQEWRIIQFGRRGGEEVVKPSFRVSGGCVIPFTEVEFKASKNFADGILPIELICYGPTLSTHTTERSLHLLSAALGYQKGELKIVRSTVPFTT